MISPITYTDLGAFLQMVVHAFQAPLFYMFVLLVVFSVLYHVKHLVVDGL
jgi:hypothetical protein